MAIFQNSRLQPLPDWKQNKSISQDWLEIAEPKLVYKTNRKSYTTVANKMKKADYECYGRRVGRKSGNTMYIENGAK